MNARKTWFAAGVFLVASSALATSRTPTAALADIGYPAQDLYQSPGNGLQDPYPALQKERSGHSPALYRLDLTEKIRMEVLAVPEGGDYQKVEIPLIRLSW
ncbi:MAG: hypothetical protein ABSE59_00630 [Opitutaceae bacterium]|jgi:hypothetical protein